MLTTGSHRRFLKEFAAVQGRLDLMTLKPGREIGVVVDFAANYEMEQRAVGSTKCEHGTTCSQYVALVIHHISTSDGIERKCDVFRAWSEETGSAAIHDAMLREIVVEMR